MKKLVLIGGGDVGRGNTNYETELIDKEIVKMTKILPALFGYSEDNLNKKYQYFIEKGYTLEEIIKMTKPLPTIFNLS